MEEKGYILSKAESERKVIQVAFCLGPPLWYFHRHRKVLLSSTFAQKRSSYYNPQMNELGYSEASRIHHYQELLVRSLLGYGLGYLTSWKLYGPKK